MPYDYIICGQEAEVAKWAEIAHSKGIIKCGRKSYQDSCCSIGGCGISDGDINMQVIRINNAEDFVGDSYEMAIMLTRKPAPERLGYEEKARQLISIVLGEMNPDLVRCYEPSEGGTWREFCTNS